MSLDDRIRELSDSIIREVRAPIEASLHQILSEVASLAAQDREAAVRNAVSTAAADHEAAMADLQQQVEQACAQAVLLRADFERERDEREAALREALAREKEIALDGLRGDHEAALAALRRSFVGDHESALSEQRLQLEQERATALDVVGQEHDRHLAALRDELTIAHEAAMNGMLEMEKGQAQARGDLESHVSALEAELEQARREIGQAATAAEERSSDAAQKAADAEAQLRVAEQQVVDGAARLHAAEEKAADVEARRQAAEQQLAEATAKLQDAEQQLADAAAKLQAAEEKAADAGARCLAAEQKIADAEQQATRLQAADREQDLACSDRTLASFRNLDAAQSLTEVMEVLADQAAAEVGRVALLVVHGSRLKAWTTRGFAAVAPGAVDAPIEPGSLFGLVTATGLPVSSDEAPLGIDGSDLARLLAPQESHVGLAAPIIVGGRVAAILYADDVGVPAPTVPSSWPELAEILARHAGQRLEVLTLSHAAALAGGVHHDHGGQELPGVRPSDLSLADERREEESARRYARLLISEIKLYNESAVEQGRRQRDLLGRLGPDIERARRLYEEKIPAAVRSRVNCFDQEVVRTLAGGDPDLLGQT